MWSISRHFALVCWIGSLLGSSLLGGSAVTIGAESNAAVPTEATHSVLRNVKVKGATDKHTLQSFAVGPRDEIFALVAKTQRYGAIEEAAEELAPDEQPVRSSAKPRKQPKTEQPEKATAPAQVKVYALDGTLQREWDVDFTALRIAVGPDGTVYLGGDGKLVKYADSGKKLAEIVAPQMQAFSSNEALMRQQAEEQLKEEREQAERMTVGFARKLTELKELADTQPADAQQPVNVRARKPAARQSIELIGEVDENNLLQIELDENMSISVGVSKTAPLEQQIRMVEAYRQMYAQFAERTQKRTIDQVLTEMRNQKSGINAITVSEKDLFVATPMMKGYGFAVWRLSPDLTSPEQIVKQLSGCCGQMDLQCRGDSLYVAENGRHRVQEFDRTGEKVASWGTRDRNGKAECFGGCCNPMNLCFDNLGRILTAESEGFVKAFDKDGKFQSVVGKAPVSGGCKNVAIATTKDGRHLLFYDQGQSQIIVLAAAEPKAKAD